LQPSGRRSDWWNRVIVTENSINSYRTALKSRQSGNCQPGEDTLLEKIGIARDVQGSIPDLLTARRQRIEAEERQFVETLGLEWAT